MKRKNGFTLVELLAVIVILAIIALIATPLILNVIDNAKKGAAEASALGYIDALEKGIVEEELKGNSISKIGVYEVSSLNFVNVKGDVPTDGWIKLEKGIVTDYSLKIDEYVINYDEINKKIITTKNGELDATPSEPAPPEVSYVCKRATILHTETCNSAYCSGAGYTTGSLITYGNENVTAGNLTIGDAFDCDVDGSKTYDEDERFYYVTDLDSDSNTAVLIYYNNVSGGNSDNTTLYAYDASNVNNMGPVTAKEQLPTTEQWSNVSLKNPIRAITNETGGTTSYNGNLSLITAFDYSKYAARLLTAQEVNDACKTTVGEYTKWELDSCNYLMENTKYSNSSLLSGYWLETPSSSYTNYVWYVGGDKRYVNLGKVSSTSILGVRPVIEVPKTEIEY